MQGVGIEEWYSQVQQLRRDAEDYKQRGQRTHFSREHLAQLTARNAQLWDIVSNHRYRCWLADLFFWNNIADWGPRENC